MKKIISDQFTLLSSTNLLKILSLPQYITSEINSSKMQITDKVPVKNGSDFTFVCSRIPFAVSCSSILPHGDYNLIDLDLVLKMKIPLQRIRVEKYSIMGETMRTVGFISQTIQCVQQGRISGKSRHRLRGKSSQPLIDS